MGIQSVFDSGFKRFSESAFDHDSDSIFQSREDLLTFGVEFLDDALEGIFKHDLVLVGAPTGAGKTQFVINLAMANINKTKKVHLFALESDPKEVEARMRFSILSQCWFNDAPFDRMPIPKGIRYSNWLLREYDSQFERYKPFCDSILKACKDLFIHYKIGTFTVDNLTDRIMKIAGTSDLIIIDHVHYFDYQGKESENEALRKIAMTTRDLSNSIGTPILLVGHLRKRDRGRCDKVPAIEEFHGSSDLTKIATKIITIARDHLDQSELKTMTHFRIGKARMEGGVTNLIGSCYFDLQTKQYAKAYILNKLSDGGDKIKPIESQFYPRWAKQ